jgi:D-xylonolactonase
VQYSPQGQELQRIVLPARKVSSVVFGGDDYADLYITTAGGGRKTEEGAGAGCLFRLRGAGQGRPESASAVSR